MHFNQYSRTPMRRLPSCLTCARLLHSILFQRPIRCDYEMDYPRASDSSTRGSQARGTRLPTAKEHVEIFLRFNLRSFLSSRLVVTVLFGTTVFSLRFALAMMMIL